MMYMMYLPRSREQASLSGRGLPRALLVIEGDAPRAQLVADLYI